MIKSEISFALWKKQKYAVTALYLDTTKTIILNQNNS